MNKTVAAQEAVTRVKETIERLQKEIADRRSNMEQARDRALSKPGQGRMAATSWFAVWSRHAPSIARAQGQLDRARKRLPLLQQRAEEIATKERKLDVTRKRLRAATAAISRRIDANREALAGQAERWDRERQQEDRNMKRLRKRLVAPTTKDQQPQKPEWRRRTQTASLPPVVQQPPLIDEPSSDAVALPPRDGLIEGTYEVWDPVRAEARRLLLNPDPLPRSWTADHVGKRLIEAHEVLRRIPMNIWPQGYSALWPEYTHDAGELAIQAGAGTLELGRNIIIKGASAIELARMNEALLWPIQFLSINNAWALSTLNTWASDPRDEEAPRNLLQTIADFLNAANEVVR